MKQLIKNSVLILMAILLPAKASAHDFEVDGIYYNINGIKATVTYRGTNYYQFTNEYTGSVVIPTSVSYNGTIYPVTDIGIRAFSDCSDLTNINIPNSITTIGNSAFQGCSQLTSVNIPNSVTFIGDQTFLSCSSLTSINIPSSVTTISHNAFGGCSGLNSVVVASDNLNYDSRNDCNAIIETVSNTLIVGCKNSTIPTSITSIGECAFNGCKGLSDITIPNSVTSIGDGSFSGCTGLTSIIIPNSVTSIGATAFMSCNGLTSINIPNSVTSIGNNAFGYCTNLTSVTIGKSVTTIGAFAFGFCYGLTSISFPNSVTSIGQNAFHRCTGLTSIIIPSSITLIGTEAFSCCDRLTYINVDSGNIVYDSRNNCNAIIETASNTLIAGCANSIIPNTVKTIGKYAFYFCNNLKSIEIPNSVSFIDEKAFMYCSNLQTVTCLNVTPPLMASSECFSTSVYDQATLRVPRKALTTYNSTDYWYKFNNIEGYGSAGLGDVNADGKISIADVTALIYLMLRDGDYNHDGDFNYNGKLDIGDVTTLIDYLLTSI